MYKKQTKIVHVIQNFHFLQMLHLFQKSMMGKIRNLTTPYFEIHVHYTELITVIKNK